MARINLFKKYHCKKKDNLKYYASLLYLLKNEDLIFCFLRQYYISNLFSKKLNKY